MGTIAVGQIEPGMVQADDLKDRNGRFLLTKGVELTTKHLKVIKTWGVVEADIDGIHDSLVSGFRCQVSGVRNTRVENGTFAWALRENRAVIVSIDDYENRLIRQINVNLEKTVAQRKEALTYRLEFVETGPAGSTFSMKLPVLQPPQLLS